MTFPANAEPLASEQQMAPSGHAPECDVDRHAVALTIGGTTAALMHLGQSPVQAGRLEQGHLPVAWRNHPGVSRKRAGHRYDEYSIELKSN